MLKRFSFFARRRGVFQSESHAQKVSDSYSLRPPPAAGHRDRASHGVASLPVTVRAARVAL